MKLLRVCTSINLEDVLIDAAPFPHANFIFTIMKVPPGRLQTQTQMKPTDLHLRPQEGRAGQSQSGSQSCHWGLNWLVTGLLFIPMGA